MELIDLLKSLNERVNSMDKRFYGINFAFNFNDPSAGNLFPTNTRFPNTAYHVDQQKGVNEKLLIEPVPVNAFENVLRYKEPDKRNCSKSAQKEFYVIRENTPKIIVHRNALVNENRKKRKQPIECDSDDGSSGSRTTSDSDSSESEVNFNKRNNSSSSSNNNSGSSNSCRRKKTKKIKFNEPLAKFASASHKTNRCNGANNEQLLEDSSDMEVDIIVPASIVNNVATENNTAKPTTSSSSVVAGENNLLNNIPENISPRQEVLSSLPPPPPPPPLPPPPPPLPQTSLSQTNNIGRSADDMSSSPSANTATKFRATETSITANKTTPDKFQLMDELKNFKKNKLKSTRTSPMSQTNSPSSTVSSPGNIACVLRDKLQTIRIARISDDESNTLAGEIDKNLFYANEDNNDWTD